MRVALDTNVLVSAFATRGLCADLLRVVLAEHQLVIGVTVLAELRRILRRKLNISAEAVDELIAFLRREGEVITRGTKLHIKIRDKSDLAVMAEAIGEKADVLVTGDRDLLEVANLTPLPILTPRGFWAQLRAT